MKLRIARKVLRGDPSRYRPDTLARARTRENKWRRAVWGISPLFPFYARHCSMRFQALAAGLQAVFDQMARAFLIPLRRMLKD